MGISLMRYITKTGGDYEMMVTEFELRSRYYIHFRTNTLEKVVNLLILPCYGLNSIITILLQERFWHLITLGGWFAIKQRYQKSEEFVTNLLVLNIDRINIWLYHMNIPTQ